MNIKFAMKMIKCRNTYYRLKLVIIPGFESA
jgi:predicted nucleic-acid-binding Zn-ribbon protein